MEAVAVAHAVEHAPDGHFGAGVLLSDRGHDPQSDLRFAIVGHFRYCISLQTILQRRESGRPGWQGLCGRIGDRMTAAARRVLGDCEAALNMLEDEEDERRWRVLWAGAMALLRTVGHVLRNVDGADASVHRVVDAAWGRWKADRSSNAVFWEFIEEERNNILKEYRFSVLDSAEVGLVVVAREDEDSGHPVQDEAVFSPGENLFRPLVDGFGTGEDARDVYGEALQWWDAELSRIEAALCSMR